VPKPRVLLGLKTEYERDAWASPYLSVAAIEGDCTSRTQMIRRTDNLFMGQRYWVKAGLHESNGLLIQT